MENQVYNWFVKQGNLVVHQNGDLIQLIINYETGYNCLLTIEDTIEIVEILTMLSRQIWERKSYVRKPYKQLFVKQQNEYFWEIDTSQLVLNMNREENAIEIKYKGNNEMNLEINCVVEIIQILEHLAGIN